VHSFTCELRQAQPCSSFPLLPAVIIQAVALGSEFDSGVCFPGMYCVTTVRLNCTAWLIPSCTPCSDHSSSCPGVGIRPRGVRLPAPSDGRHGHGIRPRRQDQLAGDFMLFFSALGSVVLGCATVVCAEVLLQEQAFNLDSINAVSPCLPASTTVDSAFRPVAAVAGLRPVAAVAGLRPVAAVAGLRPVAAVASLRPVRGSSRPETRSGSSRPETKQH